MHSLHFSWEESKEGTRRGLMYINLWQENQRSLKSWRKGHFCKVHHCIWGQRGCWTRFIQTWTRDQLISSRASVLRKVQETLLDRDRYSHLWLFHQRWTKFIFSLENVLRPDVFMSFITGMRERDILPDVVKWFRHAMHDTCSRCRCCMWCIGFKDADWKPPIS